MNIGEWFLCIHSHPLKFGNNIASAIWIAGCFVLNFFSLENCLLYIL